MYETVTKGGVKILALEPDYQVVKDNTTPNEKDGPCLMLGR